MDARSSMDTRSVNRYGSTARVAPERYRRAAYARAAQRRRARRRPRRPRGRHRALKGLAALCLIGLVLAGLAGAGPLSVLGSLGRTAGRAVAGVGASSSTPRSAWRAGEVPALYQTDPQWASHPYAGGTLAENGCGPTCLAMAYIALTGRADYDPAAMADFAEEGGHTVDGMTAWTLMTQGAADLGLSSEELPADAGAVRAALGEGRVVIASVRPGDFTTTGHFIVLAGLTSSGALELRDPNSAERTAEAWDIERVLGQCNNLWALGA